MKVIIVDDEIDRLTNLINDDNVKHEASKEYYKMLLGYLEYNSVELSSVTK